MEQLDEIFCTFAHTKHSRVKCTQSWTVNPQHWFSTVGNAFPVSLYMCACFSSRSTLVIISYAWRPNPRWHLEWRAKGLSVQFPVSTVDGKGSTEEKEKAFCTFSQQLNNPHALRIDRLPREVERGRDGEKGRKRGRAWVFGSKGEHAALDGIVVHFVCMCVYAWGVWWAPLALARGPHSARSLWLSSLDGGHSWWGHDSLCPPRQSQHEHLKMREEKKRDKL